MKIAAGRSIAVPGRSSLSFLKDRPSRNSYLRDRHTAHLEEEKGKTASRSAFSSMSGPYLRVAFL